jgi:hypothetical protein
MSTIGLIVLLVVLFGGGGGYYLGPWRGGAKANHLVGLLITVLIIVVLLRLLGVY